MYWRGYGRLFSNMPRRARDGDCGIAGSKRCAAPILSSSARTPRPLPEPASSCVTARFEAFCCRAAISSASEAMAEVMVTTSVAFPPRSRRPGLIAVTCAMTAGSSFHCCVPYLTFGVQA